MIDNNISRKQPYILKAKYSLENKIVYFFHPFFGSEKEIGYFTF